MNQLETGEPPEAAHSRSNSQQELAEVLRQRTAISAVLSAIANSPHDLQPLLDTIIDSAVHLCRAEWGAFRLVEEIGFRLVSYRPSPCSAVMINRFSVLGRIASAEGPPQTPGSGTADQPL
jgi:hypothetical protein